MNLTLRCAAFLALSGCVSLTSMETGRSVGQGAEALDLSLTSGAFSEVSVNGDRDDFSDEAIPVDYVPVPSIGYVDGVGARTDVSMRADMSTFLGVRAKHQIVGTSSSPVARAVGVEAGANVGALLFGFGYGHANASVVGSVHPHPGIAVFASACYRAVGVEPLAPPPESSRTDGSGWAFPSLSYGVAVGDRHRVGAEVVHAGSVRPSQVAIGYRRRLR